MGDEFCPRCGQKRLGAFRYCRGCGFDFDVAPPAVQPDPERPGDAPTQTAWVAQRAPGAPLWGSPQPPAADPGPSDGPRPRASRRRWPRYAALGVAALLGIGAIGSALSPEDGSPATDADPAPVPNAPAIASSRASTSAPPTTAPAEAGFGPTGPTEVATVTRITDGDTIRVSIEGADVPVRYIGVDTPEPDDPDRTKKALADAATAANAALVEGREVVLERDVSDTDQFGRQLRDVWVEGPRGGLVLVGLELVRTGYAQVATYPPDVKYVDRLLAAQVTARDAGAGLWAPTPTEAPTLAPVAFADDGLVVVGTDDRARFEGAAGEYAWTGLEVDGDRMTVRWDVTAATSDCAVSWRIDPAHSERIRSTVRVNAGDRERDNRRYDIDFTDAAFVVASSCPVWVMTMQTSEASSGADCDDSYIGVCIPPYPPDLDCPEVGFRDFKVRGSDPHGFDRDNDGVGCES